MRRAMMAATFLTSCALAPVETTTEQESSVPGRCSPNLSCWPPPMGSGTFCQYSCHDGAAYCPEYSEYLLTYCATVRTDRQGLCRNGYPAFPHQCVNGNAP